MLLANVPPLLVARLVDATGPLAPEALPVLPDLGPSSRWGKTSGLGAEHAVQDRAKRLGRLRRELLEKALPAGLVERQEGGRCCQAHLLGRKNCLERSRELCARLLTPCSRARATCQAMPPSRPLSFPS